MDGKLDVPCTESHEMLPLLSHNLTHGDFNRDLFSSRDNTVIYPGTQWSSSLRIPYIPSSLALFLGIQTNWTSLPNH